MGFYNHTFYESYGEHNRWDASEADYYAFLSVGQGQCLDSHKVGIDGPIMHWDAQVPRKQHLATLV